MNKTKWLFNPIIIMVFSITALSTSLFLYIYWYIEASNLLKSLVHNFNIDPDQILEPQTWVVILVLSLLVGIILMGISIIFVYNHKILQLYRLQHNFINNFTHELKTPVTSLKLYLETMKKYNLPRPDRIKYLDFMLSDVNRLSENINSILNLAKIESKSYKKEFVQTDLIKTIERFLKSNKHLFHDCKIKIHKSLNKPLLYRINLPLFEMLLMNIMTNAVKYNESKIPEINIEFQFKEKKLLILFIDNGIGLNKDETKKIFRKFYQSEKSAHISAQGTGLGLSLVQTIAKIHRGKIMAKNNENSTGSVFTLILPDNKKKYEKINTYN